jgi:hypothetical protein
MCNATKTKKAPRIRHSCGTSQPILPRPQNQAEKDDRVKMRNLLACRAKIREVIVQACDDGELKYEGRIGGWKHSFLEQNPYPRSRPGFVNKFPRFMAEDFKQNDWLEKNYRLQKQRYDSKGREYGYVYYSDEHITISANEFKRWFSPIGKRLIDDLFDSSVKSIEHWWDDLNEPRKPIYDRRNADFLLWLKENPNLKPEGMSKNEIKKQLILRNSGLWASGFEGWRKQQQFFKGKPGRRPKPKPN